jgi:hypothetical protein
MSVGSRSSQVGHGLGTRWSIPDDAAADLHGSCRHHSSGIANRGSRDLTAVSASRA